MNQMEKMIQAAEGAFTHVLKLKNSEKVLVVTDQKRKSIGQAFLDAAKGMGADTEIILLVYRFHR